MFARHLLLASASPRRAELLLAAGFTFDVAVADVDETMIDGEAPSAYVRRLAEAKADAVSLRGTEHTVIGADTVVVLDGQVLGKPMDTSDARRMLTQLSGREHVVLTGVAVIGGGRRQIEVGATTVEFSPLTPEEVEWYVASGEPMDKAGAYGIQGLGGRFIRRLDGSYSNVVGLPVAVVYQMLTAIAR